MDEFWNSQKEFLERLESTQQQFKNSSLIVIGDINNTEWLNFQLGVPGGMMRLFHVPSVQEAVKLINNLYDMMKDKAKFEKQAMFIEITRRDYFSSAMALSILKQCFSELEIPESDCNLIVQYFSSVARLIECSHEVLNIPGISNDSMEKIRCFFNAKAPSLRDSLPSSHSVVEIDRPQFV